MKALLLALALTGCVSVKDVEKHLGDGAVCQSVNGMCSWQGKQFICFTREAGFSQEISCAEIVPGTLK